MLDTPIQDEKDATTRCRGEQGGFIGRFITETWNPPMYIKME